MPEADVNGIRLYYEEHGHGAPITCGRSERPEPYATSETRVVR